MTTDEDERGVWGNVETTHFYELTPDRVLDAVERFGVRCTGRVLPLNSLENRVYEVEIIPPIETRSPSEAFRVVKFYRPNRWTREQILEEHQFIQDLAAQEIPVIAPIVDDEGQSLQCDPGTGIYFSLFPKMGGRILDELNPTQIDVIGRLLGRVHSVAATRTMEHRLRLDPETYGFANADFLEDSPLLPENFKSRLLDLADALCELMEPWFAETPAQRIHGDCHLGNILWRDDELSLVDFDDSLRGPCVQDIWLLLPGRDTDSLERRERLLRAYEEFRDFDRGSLRLVEALRALRIIHFNSWIARRWEDPSFQRVFPDFGTERYWAEQVGALYEQLELLQGV